jgi:pimeloyl-ACP methyl ester carboxylesterase
MERSRAGTVIHLERLTPPTSAGARDVVGSIKIFFQKLANRHLGMDYPYPLVRTADVAGDGSVTYSPPGDMAAVRARVTAAQRILIYMHGFVGDTRGMTASSRTEWLQLPNPVPAVGERYDLILTVDYENITTRIDETARAIKQRLHDAGLPPQHGKTVHLVAHSMGGLVSRWLIEKEKGHEVIQHLVVLGTPSSGTPWVKIQDWATFAIGVGLNSLATVAWPVKVIGSLVGFFEKIDDPLDQMRPNSEFLRTLAESDDPHVPYSVIAGNTSLIPSMLVADPNDPQGRSRLERFLASLNVPRIVHALTSVGFLGAPNDIAVSVASIRAVPDNRQPAPIEVEVACDHVSYFSTEAGLRALAEALTA